MSANVRDDAGGGIFTYEVVCELLRRFSRADDGGGVSSLSSPTGQQGFCYSCFQSSVSTSAALDAFPYFFNTAA